MRKLFKLVVVLVVLAAIGSVIKKLLEQQDVPLPVLPEDGGDLQTFDESELGGEVSQELLDILVCPEDKGPLQLSDDGKWLINPRNGYRYPIRKGIPVMLIEEGRKNRDESVIVVSPEEETT